MPDFYKVFKIKSNLKEQKYFTSRLLLKLKLLWPLKL